MTDTPPTRYRFKLAGVVVAVLAFGLTRFVVAEAMAPTASVTGFLLGQGPFLIAGLVVSVVGVGLAVSTVDTRYANTVALWAVVGAGVMGLVLASSVLEATYTAGAMSAVDVSLGSKVLIGGLLGGTLTGFTIARNRRHQAAVDHQNDRLVVLNRLLRHHVLNKANIISGYSDGEDAISADDATVLRQSARHITDTIEGVSGLTETHTTGDPSVESVDLTDLVATVVQRVEGDGRGAPIETALAADPLRVEADHRLDGALGHLLTHCRQTSTDGAVIDVSTVRQNAAAAVRITAEGSLLTARERELLESGGLPNYDDPAVGFELPMARLLLDQMNAIVTVDAAASPDSSETITIWFPRSDGTDATSRAGWAVSPRNVALAGVAGVVAGVMMGILVQVTLGQIAVIGSLYGTGDAVVGWITHLFHSAVFGIVFAAICAVPRLRDRRNGWPGYVAVGAVYALGLWLVAASVVMPLWLSLVGIRTPVPTFRPSSLVAHLLWGVVVSVSYVGLQSGTADLRVGAHLRSLPGTAPGNRD
jgi:hypothetical protein